MRGLKKAFLTAWGLLLCLLIWLPVSEAAIVTVTGQGSSERGAVKAALRQAIEQQVGVMVDSRSYVSNYRLLHDRIYTKAEGYIKSYEVLESSSANGIHTVKVRADVQTEKISAALGSLAQKKAVVGANMQDPRIGVLAMDAQGRTYASVENTLIQGLTSQGFTRVVDMGQVADSLRRRLLSAGAAKDRSTWQALKVQSPVDYLVTAKVELKVGSLADYVPSPGFANLKKASALIAVRMFNANTGEVVYAGNFQGKSERRSAQAEQEAIVAATKGIAAKVGEAALNKAANPEQHLTLLVTGGKLGNMTEATEYLQGLPGVNNAFVRSSAFATMTIDVDFVGTAHDFAVVLENSGHKVLEMGSEYVKI